MECQNCMINFHQNTTSINFQANSEMVVKFDKLGIVLPWPDIENRYTLIVHQQYNFAEVLEYVLLLLLLS